MTTATANGGRQRTATDVLPQATRAAALAAAAGTWVRDEEADTSRTSDCQHGLESVEALTEATAARILAAVATEVRHRANYQEDGRR